MSDNNNLISINEALDQNINRLKMPKWTNSMDHVLIQNEHPGNSVNFTVPWIQLYSPMNISINKHDPVDISIFYTDVNEKIWEVYEGPLPDSEEYKDEEFKFKHSKK